MPKQGRQELDFLKLAKRGLITAGILLTLFMVILLFFTPRVSGLLIGGANRFFLSSNQLHLSGKISGSVIPNGVALQDVQIVDLRRNQELLRANALTMGLHWSTIFKKNMVLSRIALENATLDTAIWTLERSNQSSKRKINLIFHRLALDSVIVHLPKTANIEAVTISKYRGSGWFLDGFLYTNTDSASIVFADPINQSVQFSGGLSLEGALSGQLIDFGIQIASGSGILNAAWQPDSLGGNVMVPKLDVAALLKSQKIKTPFDTLYLVNMGLDVLNRNGNWIADGNGRFRFDSYEPQLRLNRLSWDSLGLRADASLSEGDQRLMVTGSYSTDGQLSMAGELSNLDFSSELPEIPPRQVSGEFIISGDEKLQKTQLMLDHFTVGLYQVEELTLLAIRNSRNQFKIDSLGVDLGHSQASLAGIISADTLSLAGQVTIGELGDWFTPLDSSTTLGGTAEVEFDLSGSPAQPRLSGHFHQRKIGIAKTVQLDGMGKFSLEKRQKDWTGELVLQSESGHFLEDTLRNLNLTATLFNKQISLNNFNLRTDRYLLAGTGSFSPDSFQVQRLNMMVGDLSVSLAEPLKIRKGGSGASYWVIPRSVFTVNRGGMAVSGQIGEDGALDLNLNAELISIATISRALNIARPTDGELTGQFAVKGTLVNPTIDATFNWNKPVLGKLIADNFKFNGVLKNRELNITRAELVRGNKSVYLVGAIPVGYTSEDWEQARDKSQMFSVKFTNYPMKELLITDFRGTPIAGILSGTLNIRGTAKHSVVDGNLGIADGRWGKLDFNRGTAIFSYQQGIISFDSLSISSNWGVASGLGYLSGRLDLRPDSQEPPAVNPMDLAFKGNFTSLKFLTAYLPGLDQLTGDFTADMHLYGSYEEPIRDMKIRGHHATLALAPFDNKITDIHTELTMQNNLMTINHFSGKMRYEQGTALQRGGIVSSVTELFGSLIGMQTVRQYSGDIFITGVGDFSSFFHPRFNLRLEGDQIYYRNLAGGIEAIADLDMTIEGQDTIRINAEMPVLNALYYNNFSSQKTYDVSQPGSGTKPSTGMLTYNLHTIFPGNLRIDNDFISAEMDGELWLLDYGDGQLRFSGTLEAEPGGKFFYLGNVLTIERGTLTFDPIEFNPTISDFVVSTFIEGERIDLVVSGDLKEPQLSLEASQTTTHTMDDILTYLTINQKVTEGISLAASSIRDPVRSYVGLLVNKTGERLLSRSVGLDYLDIQSPYLGTATGDTTRILMGQQISRDLKMTYQTDFNRLDPNLEYKFGVEYRVNKNVSLIGNVNQDGLVELRSRVRYSY
ncbi:MAG: translocation/assembly module TamB domain-containing protein [Lentisphaeria bacterium]|nr:translocation/assembly module TamB domain-containing protein [Candidatus Neomarinimicrobiota bacterium]MCF7842375.1 translocation/assembly module TamB domain-containing protein [Lentisphaeria bacterium]